MPNTRTYTSTKTFTRIKLLKIQVDRVLTRSWIDEQLIERILKGVEEKLIQEIIIRGIDSSGACWAELTMYIDWDRNEFHVSTGRNNVRIDSRWHADVAPEVEKTLGLFEEYLRETELEIVVNTRYRPGIDENYANDLLGYANIVPAQWAGKPACTEMRVKELDEFTIGIKLAEED